MVRFHAFALEDIGVDRALAQEADAVQLGGFFGEDVNELFADDLALRFGIGHARELVKEAVHGVNIYQVRVHFLAEHADDLLGLPFSEEAVVDVYAHQILADGFDQQRRHHRRIHAAGKRQQYLAVADLRAQRRDLFVDERFGQFFVSDTLHCFGSYIVHNNCSVP